MAGERFILRELYRQEEWRCAWEACINFMRAHPERFGRKQWMRYYFDGPDGEICIEVWRSQRGIEASRPSRAKDGWICDAQQYHA